MCYRTIKRILGSCESLCLLTEFLFWEKNSKVKFLIFFLLRGFFCCGIVVDHCGSLWDRCGSLWVVVGRCGSLRVVAGFSEYNARLECKRARSFGERPFQGKLGMFVIIYQK